MSILKKIIKANCLIIALISQSVLAEDYGSHDRFVIKGNITGVISKIESDKKNQTSKTSKFYPNKNSSADFPVQSNLSLGNTLGISASAAYFLTDNLAVEAGAGYYSQKIKASGTGPQYDSNYNINSGQSFSQDAKIKFIPFTAMVQYHIAPYGKISPYIGAGYHYTFASALSNASINSSSGLIFGGGFNAWIDDNLMINVDVKKLLMNPRITYKNNFALDSSGKPTSQIVPVSSKIKLDPMFISAGIGIRL